MEAEIPHFPVQRRTANAQFAGNFGHLTPIAVQSQADHVGFDFIKLADVTAVSNGRNPESHAVADDFAR